MTAFDIAKAGAIKQKELFDTPALTVDQREEYIKWIDKIHNIINNLNKHPFF